MEKKKKRPTFYFSHFNWNTYKHTENMININIHAVIPFLDSQWAFAEALKWCWWTTLFIPQIWQQKLFLIWQLYEHIGTNVTI